MSDKLSYSDIEDIMQLIDASSFDQFNLEMGDIKVSLKRTSSDAPVSVPVVAEPVIPSASPATLKLDNSVSSANSVDGLTDVASQMLGTFYHSSKPGANPFVSIGTKVMPDTVIGIIEVMKLMTSVEAGISGTVAEIVAPNGELVEHGQVLIRVQQD